MSHEHNKLPGMNGQCPAGWRDKPLSSVAELRVSNVDKKSESRGRSVRLCNYTDVYNNDYIDANRAQFQNAATQL